ncbi:hypothetical protein BJ166DRAFT_18078 [Pestalotiopsis sp. NC0098]|nr:hypothetical protein BJ166DRAFT_18078 [Pestalotiopsis sp. NC0098]
MWAALEIIIVCRSSGTVEPGVWERKKRSLKRYPEEESCPVLREVSQGKSVEVCPTAYHTLADWEAYPYEQGPAGNLNPARPAQEPGRRARQRKLDSARRKRGSKRVSGEGRGTGPMAGRCTTPRPCEALPGPEPRMPLARTRRCDLVPRGVFDILVWRLTGGRRCGRVSRDQ